MLLLATALLAYLAFAPPAAIASVPFSDTERAAVLLHGPWPPVLVPDPSNRSSGNTEAIALGRALFFDVRLSSGDSASCATCHVPELVFTDGRATAEGTEALERNTPTLINVRFNRWFGWDGANDSLWGQSLRPVVSPREMALTLTGLANLIAGDEQLGKLFISAYGLPFATLDAETVFVLAGKALAAYQETLVSSRTAFDDFRDALASGDETASDYPDAARRGLRLFVGEAGCNNCHLGPLFSNGEFADIGISRALADGGSDSGRFGGLQELSNSRYTRAGSFSDDPRSAGDTFARPTSRNRGEFRVPSLRNAALTAPYMHNGSMESLEAVIEHYSNVDAPALPDEGKGLLRPLQLDAGQKQDLLAFLVTLSRPSAHARAR